MPNLRVYILSCADNSFYTGVTNDIERRLQEHNSGINQTCYTFNRRPVMLKWLSDELSPKTAIDLEKRIKHWSHKKKQALMEGQWDKLIEYSKKKFN